MALRHRHRERPATARCHDVSKTRHEVATVRRTRTIGIRPRRWPDFIRRQHKDAAGIPLRVWLAVLDQGLAADAYADLQATLPRLKAPTLLIWGSKDPIMEPEVRQSLRDGLPDAKVKVFEGLGHNPFWEDPRGVADVINAFLDPQP
jgi:pimeloyl-ACP methyl ester carboxylesterase